MSVGRLEVWSYREEGREEELSLMLDSRHSIEVYTEDNLPREPAEEITAVAAARIPRYVPIQADMHILFTTEDAVYEDMLPDRSIWVRIEDLTEEFGDRYPLQEILSDDPVKRASKIYRCIHPLSEEPASAGCGAGAGSGVLDMIDAAFGGPIEIKDATAEIDSVEEFLKETGPLYKKELTTVLDALSRIHTKLLKNHEIAKAALSRLTDPDLESDTELDALKKRAEACIQELEKRLKAVSNAIALNVSKETEVLAKDSKALERFLMAIEKKHINEFILDMPYTAEELALLKTSLKTHLEQASALHARLDFLRNVLGTKDKRILKRLDFLIENCGCIQRKLELWVKLVPTAAQIRVYRLIESVAKELVFFHNFLESHSQNYNPKKEAKLEKLMASRHMLPTYYFRFLGSYHHLATIYDNGSKEAKAYIGPILEEAEKQKDKLEKWYGAAKKMET